MEEEADRLFDLPPAEFTAARDALAKRLRADGDREAAAAVKALRRPTLPAWGVNQLARRHPEAVAELLDAGRDLRRAQRRALSGRGAAALRDATSARRAAVDRLLRLAQELDERLGAHADALAATLEAATVDAEAAEQVQEGRLAKELPAPAGFGELGGLEVLVGGDEKPPDAGGAEDEAATQAPAEPPPEVVEAAERAREQAAVAAEDARRAQQAARSARRTADEAADEAAAAERRAAAARGAADAAARKAASADAEAARLEELAERRGRDAEGAEQRLASWQPR